MARQRRALAGLAAVVLLGGCGSTHHRASATQAPHTTVGRAPLPRPQQGRVAVTGALLSTLPAFRRQATITDAWTGDTRRFGQIRASRRIATLDAPPRRLSLYLLATSSGTCLELPGRAGDCNDAPNFFGQSPIELIDADPVIAGVLAPGVGRVALRTPTQALRVAINGDRAILFLCAGHPNRPSCAGDELVGTDRRGRQLFGIRL